MALPLHPHLLTKIPSLTRPSDAFSLSGNDFYPLIHIRTKGVTYDEKVAYRASHDVPGTIDKWIADEKMRTKHPPPIHTSVARLSKVCCGRMTFYLDVAHFIIRQGLVEGDVQDPNEFTLTLRIRVPPTTGFLMYYCQSPTVVIDQYTGASRVKLSPEWLETMQIERRFWQSRTLMLEMMFYFVRKIPHNTKVSTRVRSWCSAMSVSNIL